MKNEHVEPSSEDLNLRTAAHGSPADSSNDLELPEVDLLSPITMRGITLRNRIAMSPMCQYCATDGFATDWHLVHLGSRAAGGTGLIIVEATAVTPEGRISPSDVGLWSDEHIAPLARIADFVASQGAVPGIQLAHAGRKACVNVPWKGGASIKPEEGGWPIVGAGDIPFSDGDQIPHPLDNAEIDNIVAAFEAAARRALVAGFKVIELHAAHGYLLHQFLSPLSNNRQDKYGGSLQNRMRLTLQIAKQLRDLIPDELLLFVRISATDWVDGGWNIDESVELAKRLKDLGVDLIDVSSGGLVPTAHIPVGKGYQVQFARRIREESGIMTSAVGIITEPSHANEIITGGDADLVLLGRELLRDPYWAQKALHELGGEQIWPVQYNHAFKRRTK
ncbi:MAG: NADH:flavin oxidoreductase/NADH oxidase [Bacteroidota bacterium]|nr:NADH:flavin oxidoreductase/NADH oxidase [Bacteroidota bacterium]